ncbi:Zinc finger BED domain-containing protein RICESLEEPER 2 [Linum perenne]
MIICCPDFRIPCRKTIRSECFKIFLLSKARLKEFFKNSCASRVSITTDTWTRDWKLHKKIINFSKITSHKGDDIGAKLAECLEEWGLKNVFTVTLDNASTNDVACTFLKGKLETWGTSFMSGRYLHVRCVAHIVNLVVNDGLNEIGMSVKRVREAVRWVRSSGSREAKFHAQVTAQNVQSKRMVSLDCQTRWNSTFLMLDTALVYERVFTVLDAIDPTFKEDLFARKTSSGAPIGTPTAEDWKLVRNMTKFLKFFHRLTKHKVIGNRAELDKYLDDAREGAGDVTEEFDILTWWKVVGAYKYPVMSEIAKDILAIPVSSVASESAFSNGGRVLDDFRSSLLPEIVEALICSEDWLRNPDDNGNDEEDEEDQIQFMEGMSFVLLFIIIKLISVSC